ncbi:unnamed protein product [Cochlearia groenlandica]
MYNNPQFDDNGNQIDADNGQADGKNQQAYENDEITLMRQHIADFMAAQARQNNQTPRMTTMLEADDSDVFFQYFNHVQPAGNQRIVEFSERIS